MTSKKFTVIDDEGLHNFETIPGLEKASSELINFINYISDLHPQLTTSQAGYVVAYFVHNMPGLVEANPGIKTALEQAADYIKSSEMK